MNNEIIGTGTSSENNSNNSGHEPVTNFNFDNLFTNELKEGTIYSGSIRGFEVKNANPENASAILTIGRDDSNEDYESWNSLTFKHSPMLKLIKELKRTFGRSIDTKDLIGMRVEFTVKYNKEYCNINTIKRIADQDITPF